MNFKKLSWIAVTSIFVVTVLSWAATPITNGDVFMYLAMGRHFLEVNFFPQQDPFLALPLAAGFHFHHEWLSYVFFYEIYKLAGLTGLIVAKMILFFSVLAMPMLVAKKLQTLNFRTLGLLVLAVLVAAARIGERAYLFSDIFTVLLLGLLLIYDQRKDQRWLYSLPFVFLAWVQFHPGFPVGLLILSVFAALKIFSLEKPQRKVLLIVTVASYLVCLINPLGLRGFLYPFQIFFSADWNIYRQINSEWMPLLASPYVAGLAKLSLLILGVLSLLTSILQIRRRNYFPLIVTMILGYLSWSSMRFISIAPFCFILILVAHPLKLSLRLIQAAGITSVTAVLALALYVAQFENQGFTFLVSDQQKVKAPMKAIGQLGTLAPGTVFAEWDWNSVICWMTEGRHKVVVHGHIDQPAFAVQNFLSITQSKADFQRIVEANKIRYFLLSPETLQNPQSELSKNLMSTPWKVLYQDAEAVLIGL
jgi:hypothetical protein